MDVKDYSQKLDQARDKYRMAQDDLRSSYDKSKETFDNKVKKQAKNYDAQISKLEEQNSVNNVLYSDKAKQTISKRQEDFRNEIKNKSEKFDTDRNTMKAQFNDKLSNLSDSYKISAEENNRFQDQMSKNKDDKHFKTIQSSKNEFDQQVGNLETQSKESLAFQKENAHTERQTQARENQANIDSLRASGQYQNFREVSRLKNDNEDLRTNFGLDRDLLHDQKESRIQDILNMKTKENEEGQKNFADLQQNIQNKSVAEETHVKTIYQQEARDLENKFKQDIRNMQKLTTQKIRGGNEVSSLKDENKKIVESYENRLKVTRDDAEKNKNNVIEKQNENDSNNRKEIKSLKLSKVEALEKQGAELGALHQNSFQEIRDKNISLLDRYKTDATTARTDSEDKLDKADVKSKVQLKNQRVEFGNYINSVNNNKFEEISSIKNEFKKDRKDFIEKSSRDFSDEKISIKNQFNHQINLKEDLYEKKLVEMEKQTNKIIENYENRIGQIARKAENEVESIKAIDEERKIKENQATQIAFDTQQGQHRMDLVSMRDKYERTIGKDRILNEQQTNRIVQKYEDQLGRERIDNQKETSMKIGESQAQLERAFKASEAEKESMRNLYEERMENMKLASLSSQGNSKRS